MGTISEISQKINFIRQELSFSFSDFSKYDNIELKKSSIMSKILTTNEEKSCLKNPYLFGNSKTRKSGFGLLYPTHHYNKKKSIVLVFLKIMHFQPLTSAFVQLQSLYSPIVASDSANFSVQRRHPWKYTSFVKKKIEAKANHLVTAGSISCVFMM